MVTDVYAHTHDDVRRNLAKKLEEDFFRKGEPQKQISAASSDPTLAQALQLLQDNPQLAQLLLAVSKTLPPK